jgi:hypothetical protein
MVTKARLGEPTLEICNNFLIMLVVIKNEDKSDFKCLMEVTTTEYNIILPKLNWNFSVKYSLFSINVDLLKPVHLCHLLMFTVSNMFAVSKLKVFGDDAFGKVISRYKVAAAAVNYLMEVSHVFFKLLQDDSVFLAVSG